MKVVEELKNKMEELQEISSRYTDYKVVLPSKIKYKNIENEKQEELVKNYLKSPTLVIIVATIAFSLTALLSFLLGKTTIGIISAICTLPLIYFTITTICNKPQIAFGKAVWKKEEYSNFNSPTIKMYYVYVAIEEEKVILQHIQTTKKDYEKIEEGTKIMIIKKGTTCQACVYED